MCSAHKIGCVAGRKATADPILVSASLGLSLDRWIVLTMWPHFRTKIPHTGAWGTSPHVPHGEMKCYVAVHILSDVCGNGIGCDMPGYGSPMAHLLSREWCRRHLRVHPARWTTDFEVLGTSSPAPKILTAHHVPDQHNHSQAYTHMGGPKN